MPDRPQKITFAEMRESGVLASWSIVDNRCSHSITISGDGWPDDLRLPDIERQFVDGRASSSETRPAQFLSVVTDRLVVRGPKFGVGLSVALARVTIRMI
jgi:hypothetical protein